MIKKIKPLGKFSPYAWVIEPVHGCNLSCGHCSCRLDKPKKFTFITDETWMNAWKIIATYNPTCRVDLCLGGEPTLHPRIYHLLKMARLISPMSQIQITTNGTMLLKRKVNYRDLLNSGANIIYTDMYGPQERYIEMAKASGFQWYEYYKKPEGAISPWTYTGPQLKIIVLQEQPENWPKSRLRAGLLGTWFNHLDWPAAAKFGLFPVTDPPKRRCNQPFIYVPVDAGGNYLLCCQDNVGETAGMFGNVNEGPEGFLKYWFGKTMQEYRINLRQKNRAGNSQCSRCCITFSRCDFKHWTDQQVNQYWDGVKWQQIKK